MTARRRRLRGHTAQHSTGGAHAMQPGSLDGLQLVVTDADATREELTLASLAVTIATIDGFSRVNAASRQIAGDFVARIVEATAGAPA